MKLFLAIEVIINRALFTRAAPRNGADARARQAAFGEILLGCAQNALHGVRPS